MPTGSPRFAAANIRLFEDCVRVVSRWCRAGAAPSQVKSIGRFSYSFYFYTWKFNAIDGVGYE